jgi:succinate dehydrogenase / fumarate reductase iron-sulfur subunit
MCHFVRGKGLRIFRGGYETVTRKHVFRIRRFDPERESAGGAERWDTFELEMEPSERVLDALVRIKDSHDGTLTFRRSCAHGVCGSCAMMIGGLNSLACQTLMGDMPEELRIEPLPALPTVKDLVVDMEPFFEKTSAVFPYLMNDEPPPERERRQSHEDQERILQAITCVMCSCCTNSCPSFWADKKYLGPAALLKAYRFIFDTRDRGRAVRVEEIVKDHGLWRCHSIFNCVESCPRDIDITAHISKLKRDALKGRGK